MVSSSLRAQLWAGRLGIPCNAEHATIQYRQCIMQPAVLIG